MYIYEDCINFKCDHKNVYGIGSCDAEIIPVSGCELTLMALGGCPTNCMYYIHE